MNSDDNNRNMNIDGNVSGSVIITGNSNAVSIGRGNAPNFDSEETMLPDASNPSPKNDTDNSPLIFLCHATEDKPKVKNLYHRLKASGFNPWMDEIDIIAGQNWDYEIKKTLKAAKLVVVCLSKISVEKRGYLNREINLALDRSNEMLKDDIFIMPVKLEPCALPDWLSRWQAVNLSEDDGFERLITAIEYQFDRLGVSKVQKKVPEVSGENPFYYGGAVPTRLFYGRKEILNAVLTRIGGRELQSISIVGERRMGKSSLLCYIKNKLVERLPKQHRYVIIYLDLMRAYCQTRKGLMRALRRQLTKKWKEPWEKSEDGDLSAFDFALEDMVDDDLRLILCLDEMEHLTERREEFDDLLEDWRACGQAGQMAMVTASALPLADLCCNGGLTSPFFNIFSQNYLGLLAKEEWTALITDQMPVSPEELFIIEDMTGGHPFFTQMVAASLWAMKAEGAVDFDKLRSELSATMIQHIAYSWEKLSDAEKSALRYFAGKNTVKPDVTLTNILFSRGLIKYGKPYSVVYKDFILKK